MNDIAEYFITKIDDKNSIIFDANYIIFDALLWGNAHSILKELKIEYHFIGLNVFNETEITPTLIDLNILSNEKKQEIWNLIGKNTKTNGFSGFDQMSMFQTYIYSDKKIDEIKKFLAEFMVFKKRSDQFVFRFYDPRVSIHSININALLKEEIYKKLRNYVSKWVISINHQYFEVNIQKKEIPLVGFDEIDQINQEIRYALTEQYDEDGNEISNNLPENMNELINFIYRKYLSEKKNV